MAGIPTIKKILAENFPKEKFMPQLLEPINKFFEEVTRALTNQLTVGENFDGMVKTVVLDGSYPVKFSWERKNKPVAAWIGQCREVSNNHTTRTTAIDLDWEFKNGVFQINNVPGLTVSTDSKFNLTIVAIAG